MIVWGLGVTTRITRRLALDFGGALAELLEFPETNTACTIPEKIGTATGAAGPPAVLYHCPLRKNWA